MVIVARDDTNDPTDTVCNKERRFTWRKLSSSDVKGPVAENNFQKRKFQNLLLGRNTLGFCNCFINPATTGWHKIKWSDTLVPNKLKVPGTETKFSYVRFLLNNKV